MIVRAITQTDEFIDIPKRLSDIVTAIDNDFSLSNFTIDEVKLGNDYYKMILDLNYWSDYNYAEEYWIEGEYYHSDDIQAIRDNLIKEMDKIEGCFK